MKDKLYPESFIQIASCKLLVWVAFFPPFLSLQVSFKGNVPSDRQEELETTVNGKDKLLFLSEYEIIIFSRKVKRRQNFQL